MTPRRIALVGHSYPPLVGGATRATWQVAQRDVAVTVANVWHRDTDAYEMDGRVQVVHRLPDNQDHGGSRHAPLPQPLRATLASRGDSCTVRQNQLPASATTTTHLLLTRFNLPLGISGAGGRHTDMAWLDDRIAIFERYCLPSVMAQTATDFRWVLLLWSGTPADQLGRINAALSREPRAEVLLLDAIEDWQTFGSALLDHMPVSDRYLLTTRLDNDDVLDRTYLASVQAACRPSLRSGRPSAPLALNVPLGYRWADGRLYRLVDLSNPFLSVFEDLIAGPPLTALGVAHPKVRRLLPTRQLLRSPGWIQVIHGQNLLNSAVGIRRVSSRIPLGFSATPNLFTQREMRLSALLDVGRTGVDVLKHLRRNHAGPD